MTIQTRTVAYTLGETSFEALAAWDDAVSGARPGVLVAPTFMDRSAFEDGKAEALAGLGYVGFAIDLFGTAVTPTNMDEAMAAMGTLNDDRPELARRMTEALAQMRALPEVDAARTAAIGFCFGGKAVLDLARTGSDVLGVAAFHGIFDAPSHDTAERIVARVLALHGWADDLANPQAVLTFADEMDRKGANWELDAYGHTGHGFTNAGRPQMYRPQADARSWARLQGFLGELFGAD